MPIVEIKNLSKCYDLGTFEVSALSDLDLEIQKGQYMAIMGPSGSGKSTLLNLLGCLDTPTSGTYNLAGQDVSSLDDNELSAIRGSRIGFIFQSYNLIAQLNVIENIEVPMYYQGISEHRSFTLAKELAEMVGLGDRARSLANDPVIILADEPTGNLDSKSGADILSILDDLHHRGKTLIIVTHDDNIANKAQRTIHLLDGRIERQEYNHRQ
ncbi:MAG: ABC transporter ATP-binding protein [Planctomycetota bacterium]|jgi:putative ABC transport system ATP-binding protein